MYRFRKKGFTIVELVMIISIIGILSAGGSWLLIFLVNNFTELPHRLNINMATSDILEIICEGDAQAGGLRFASQISESADNQLRFFDQDSNDVIIRVLNNKVERSVDGGVSFELIPYYTPSPLNIVGRNNQAFQYYVESGIMRVEINLVSNIGDLTTELGTSISLRK